MIRLEAFVDDKKVAAVLHALDGLVVQLNVMPVRNAIAKGGKVAEAGDPTTGPEVVRKAIADAVAAGGNTVTRASIISLGKTYGIKDSALVSAINAFMHRDRILRTKRGSKGVYLFNVTTGD